MVQIHGVRRDNARNKGMRRQKTRVLVVDHDPLFLQLLTRYLQLEGYEVDAAGDGRRAIEQMERHTPDLVLLCLGAALPHQPDALTLCQRVRERSQASIMCITALQAGEMSDLIELGADEYLYQPFDVDELLSRMQRALQHGRWVGAEQARAPAPQEDAQTMTLGDLTVDFARSRVFRSGHEIPLSPREYRLLACLAQHAGRVVSQELLLQFAWGNAHAGEHHLLQVTINRLRRKLEPDPARPRFLLTKSRKGRAVGYLLTHPNEAVQSSAGSRYRPFQS
jgi:DNA-binding response OmpR family regulator